MSLPLKRCPFAIISHPDAGKTTMTEKLIWFGGVIREAGMVKSKSGDFAKSDWMELEKQRGISITSSVISFEYNNRAMHLLDTPGHKDFSEDTYRTLTAVESALMMIDAAKGVETQTIKLMEVCRMRATPIFTFINKLDRDALTGFELLDNLENILTIQCVPMNWPVGSGVDFKGVYELKEKRILKYAKGGDPFEPEYLEASDLDSPAVVAYLGELLLDKLKEDLMMIESMIPEFEMEEFLAGLMTPVYFGTALQNFGVRQLVECITDIAPGPKSREAKLPPFDAHAASRVVEPSEDKFTGFVFKIQANMDKKHRDRISFLRVCSGKFTRNQKIFHVRSEKEIRVSTPLMFQARDRDIIDEALPGDIIGLYDSGKYQIGDTFSEGEKLQYTGIPSFAPEIFMRVVLKDPMKGKQLDKGLKELSEEGATQLFYRKSSNEKILGAVGRLQFDVVKYRLEDEYGVKADYEPVPFIGIRWPKFADEKKKASFESQYASQLLIDKKMDACLAYANEWDLKMCLQKNPDVEFFMNSDFIR